MENETAQISWMHEFILRIMEKIMQRFKVSSLRVHNALNDQLRSIKEKRLETQKSPAIAEEVSEDVVDTAVAAPRRAERSDSFFGRFRKFSEHAVPQRVEGEITDGLEKQDQRVQSEETVLEASSSSRSRLIQPAGPGPEQPLMHQEQPSVRRKSSVDTDREESLIVRISANPKDHTAYEALGDYYLEKGNAKDAKECYRQVLRLSPTHRTVKLKIRRLERLLIDQRD